MTNHFAPSDLGTPDGTATLPDSNCADLRLVSDFTFDQQYADVLGVKVSAIDLPMAVDMADQSIAAKNRGYVCVTGVHGVMEAQRDAEFLRILNHAFLNLPDGMPMTWVGHLQGLSQMDRVYGPGFMAAMCQLSVQRGYRNFFYGGEPGIADRLKEALQRRFPGLQVVGTYTPPFRILNAAEEDDLLTQVHSSKPDILWVGLSTPKQEKFMAKYIDRLEVPLLVGVGAAFDFHTGRIRDCPNWVKRAGMQWLHRLLQDPRRLWKRYLRNNPAFVWKIALQLLRLRQFPRGRNADISEV
jgi:N-acetylglucosaminyldiphosphoundecaprenol N-acetyl-beta-D-mannosaminyltransferase